MKSFSLRVVFFAICGVLAIASTSSWAQASDNESRFIAEYAQYAARADLVGTKVNMVTGGQYKGNNRASLAVTREVANLREELAEMLN